MVALHSLSDGRAEGDRQALRAVNDVRRHVDDVLHGDGQRQILQPHEQRGKGASQFQAR
jgi:hypothetical protein